MFEEIRDVPQANTKQSLMKLVNILKKEMQDLEIIDMPEGATNTFTGKLHRSCRKKCYKNG